MSKRELIDTGTDKRYVRRDDQAASPSRRTWAARSRPTSGARRRMMRGPEKAIAATATPKRTETKTAIVMLRR